MISGTRMSHRTWLSFASSTIASLFYSTSIRQRLSVKVATLIGLPSKKTK